MSEPAPPEKKPYQPPQLHVYGDIRTITQGTSDRKGRKDSNRVKTAV
ncbi:lasso RiPP family leader peptide-containing protein [Gloeobacter kilaueensis]|uniref:Lasso RiPP family leader peptide-containing protein n=1 Tax=Gloeobacter kilaueensis (strain ATCC BAA-2537 / CCAP 1431/1 / ULC 316 / JS1) TaxID=1183438 RepID=U5QHG3_GLOK1|nr:lasso RiPP family leader peptide-containing protein [Gloeobacter kilaueensis]AGY58407.1 hypothetical protein GKIL_2161 [Gloeobacter kilaueensis JS1]